MRLGFSPAVEQSDSDLGGGRQAPSVRLGFSPAAEQSDSDLGGGRRSPWPGCTIRRLSILLTTQQLQLGDFQHYKLAKTTNNHLWLCALSAGFQYCAHRAGFTRLQFQRQADQFIFAWVHITQIKCFQNNHIIR